MAHPKRNVVVDLLCALKQENCVEAVVPALDALGLTLSQTRAVISTANYQVGTREYSRTTEAVTMLCFAEIAIMKQERLDNGGKPAADVTETIQTPPQRLR